MPSSDLIVFLPENRFHDKLSPKVPNNIPKNPTFSFSASFLFFLLTPFINKPNYPNDLSVFIMSFFSSFEIISVVIREAKSKGRQPDPKIFL